MKRFIHLLFPAAFIAAISLSALAGKPDNSRELAKADYIFMESLKQSSLDNLTAHYTLLENAYRADTSRLDIGILLAPLYLSTGRTEDGMNLLRKYFTKHPEDIYPATYYIESANRFRLRDEAFDATRKLHYLYPEKDEISLNYIELLTQKSDSASYSEALALLDTLESNLGLIPDVAFKREFIYRMTNDTAALFDNARRFREELPESPQPYLYSGNLYSMYQMPDSALYYYNLAVKYDDDSGRALSHRAAFYLINGDTAKYEQEVYDIITTTDFNPEAKMSLLSEYVEAYHNDSIQSPQITKLFETAIDRDPHYTELRKIYGAYLSLFKKYSEAAEQFSYVRDLEPYDSVAATFTPRYLIFDGKYDQALKEAQVVIDRFPNYYDGYIIKGDAYLLLEQYDEALNTLMEADKLIDNTDSDTRSTLYTSIGDIYFSNNDTQSAFEYYGKAIDLDPENATALNNYAYYLSESDDADILDKAERLSYRSIIIQPDSPVFLDTYAWILFRKKEYAKAKEYIDRALTEIVPEDLSGDIIEHAGDIYFFNGEHEKALQYWEEALPYYEENGEDNTLLQKKIKHKTFFYK